MMIIIIIIVTMIIMISIITLAALEERADPLLEAGILPVDNPSWVFIAMSMLMLMLM